MWALLVMILLGALLACCLPGQPSLYSDLRESAVKALEAHIHEVGAPGRHQQTSSGVGDDDDGEDATTPAVSLGPAPFPQAPRRAATPTPGKRQRVTPFQAKHVAAAQGWRCGCGCIDPADPQRRGHVLDASFEIDHRIPIRFGGAHDPSNWVAVLRNHHQLKSAMESREGARRRR